MVGTSRHNNKKKKAKKASKKVVSSKKKDHSKKRAATSKSETSKPAASARTSNTNSPVEVYRGPPEEELKGAWPPGWLQIVVQRQVGTYKGIKDRYWFSPSCKKFRSTREIEKFLAALKKTQGDEDEAWKLFRSNA